MWRPLRYKNCLALLLWLLYICQKTDRKHTQIKSTFDFFKNYFNLLTPSGFFTFHQVSHLKILHGARFDLSVLYGYQNRQRLLLYTALSDWFL